jgi:hypothetical protein
MKGRAFGVVVLGLALLALAAPAQAASSPKVHVSPSSKLKSGEKVKVTGSGLPYETGGKVNSFFATECDHLVEGSLSPADAANCDVSVAKTVKVKKNGTFSITFTVVEAKIGASGCDTGPTSLHCVIGVGDLAGAGSVGKITFK